MPRPTTGYRALAEATRRAMVALALLLVIAPSARAERPLPPRFAPHEGSSPEAVAPARAQSTSSYDPLWVGYPLPATIGNKNAIALYGGGLVVAGSGTQWGTTTARNVAFWDGVGWQAMGSGIPTTVYSLVIRSGQLIATGGGAYSSVVGVGEKPAIFLWDGANWNPIGSANGTVNASVVVGADLYVAGRFASIDGVAAANVARWDGSSWYAVGTGVPTGGGPINALAVHGTKLVAGGNIPTCQGIAQWDGVAWTQVGAGFQSGASAGTVNSLASDGVTLFASGSFRSSGGSPDTSFAAWNGSTWSRIAGANQLAYAIAIYGGYPMAYTGSGTFAGPKLWNGSTWQAFNNPNVDPLAYAIDGGTLYASGYVPQSNGATPTTLGGFYRFDGSTWTPLQQTWTADMRGLSGNGYCAQEYHGALFVGGTFGYVGMGDHYQLAAGAAMWNGSDWTAVGAGAQHFDMTVWNDSLVACMDGWVKVWNGTTWRRLAATQTLNYTFDWTYGLAVYEGDLYVLGPQYLNPGFTPLYGLARWTGSTWVPVGGGVDPIGYAPYAGVQWGANFAIGGEFATAGGVSARNLAYWEGSAYHDIGGGVNAGVYALISDAGDLIVGGAFTEVGGDSIRGVARWDGAAWHEMGTRARLINRFRHHGGKLYAVGSFVDDASNVVQAAAVWNGTEWQLLGSGTDPYGEVYGLEFLGDDLYITGWFNSTNGHPARGIARLPNVSTLAVGPTAPHAARLALAPSPNPSRSSVRLALTLPVSGRVRLAIHDVSGREVARLLDGEHAAGAFSLAWDARVPPGLYFATIEAAGERTTTRVVRLR